DELQRVARKRLLTTPLDAEEASPYIAALAILGDTYLTALLDKSLQKGPLSAACHRALILMNTPTSLAVFCDSVDSHLDRLRRLPDATDEEKALAWDVLLPNGIDVAMYPHDALIAVIEAALESRQRDHNWFGLRWASAIPARQLLQPVADAIERWR